ncbi:TonB-dependent siderophore receptor [Sphingomonas sp. H39-1-10]|uniref:TonB-dependent siderophore receptor n=1 Tax=Sphingomonas TaxID=13687 RepID=UPI000891D1CF|nr:MULTISPECIES: TonB-dependent siderophore receptor [Sphingomonas]MDF0489321.1 TonB-dependent siderophore receptor [Sphingomonas pollutisoli]SDA30110.1 iron complex outermembrane recepter protein [Sphingomonas sp. NFR15]
MTRHLFTGLLMSAAVYCTPAWAAPVIDEGSNAAVDTSANEGDDDRDTIVVTGARPRTESSAGTKNAAPIAETPQSISVLSASDIADLGVANLNQALRFVAGVTTEQRGSSAEVYDQFKLRGFDAPQFLDGLKLIDGAAYLSPQVDVSRLDRIEIVKGPASVLYGQSGPGGLVALTSKLPLDEDFYGAVAGTYGTYDLYRVDGDVGGRAGSSVRWRVYGSVNGAHTQQTFSRRERETISGAVTIDLDNATKLTLLGAYSHDPQNGSYGVFPASGTLLANPNGQLPTDRDFGEPGNYFKRDQVAGTYILTHELNPDWGIRASGRYQHATSRLGIVYAAGPLAGDPNSVMFNRASYATRERSDSWVFDNQVHGRFTTGAIKHDVLFGVDYQTGTARDHYAFGGATPLNGYAPAYGTMPVPQSPEQVPANFGVNTIRPRSKQVGVYAQDEMSIGGLRVTLSGRQDWAAVRPAPDAAVQNTEKFTYRAGALYKTAFGLAPYVSYSTSFEPNGTINTVGGATVTAKPSEGKQLEAGAKYLVPGTNILLTAAWFRIDQTNVIVTNPVTQITSQSGRYRSTGVEIEANAPLPYGFNARLAFSRQKVRNTADADPSKIGDGILGVGRGNTTFNLEWAPREGGLKGFAIGGAVRHVDSIYAGSYTNAAGALLTRQSTPGFTVFDGLLRYDLGGASDRLQGLALSVNAANILDKKYVTTCYLDYQWCWYGNRRTVQGTISYKW